MNIPPRQPFQEAPELLAPAGDWECVRAAVANGADAIYFGLPRFNARLRAENFQPADVPAVTQFCHRHGVKTYVVMNTLIFTDELSAAAEDLLLLSRSAVDGVIIQDIGLAQLAADLVPALPVHASTQMTITSPEGLAFVTGLGVRRAVLARELSLRELQKFAGPDGKPSIPLEVFVHGALCVAYSGQCLTSESLGKRSANRGECAQACRMPYELMVDGVVRDLGDRRYLLSPQDLAGVEAIPELLDAGVTSFKIEGRLKAPEYVAAVCQVYRKALDAALAGREHRVSDHDWYQLEMTFSRGLYSGWIHGVQHQELVPATHGKKRGPFAGIVRSVSRYGIEREGALPLKPGDGVVFDTGGDTNREQGGRIWEVDGPRLRFEPGKLDLAAIPPGTWIWKTDDPALDAALRHSWSGRIEGRPGRLLDFSFSGPPGQPLRVIATSKDGGLRAEAQSERMLEAARTAPLTPEKLAAQFGRLHETGFVLGEIHVQWAEPVILPVGELNRLRRELVFALQSQLETTRQEDPAALATALARIRSSQNHVASSLAPRLSVLVRSEAQLAAVLARPTSAAIFDVYCDFEDIRRYKGAVERVRDSRSGLQILLATPRIQKAGEAGFFKVIESACPDGVLIRNLGAINAFSGSPLRRVADFSLNVANPLTASHFMRFGFERLTVSYDLNIEQALSLVRNCAPDWFEITLHQHMPMFHMEHCVFAAFLSKGKDHTDCGRPCEKHRVHLRDRVGIEHPLRADVGCRNTLFNATAQTGAKYFAELQAVGITHFRVEFLEEEGREVDSILATYEALLSGQSSGENLWRKLHAHSQLGVTDGTLAPGAAAR